MTPYEQGFEDGLAGRPASPALMRVAALRRPYMRGYEHGLNERQIKEDNARNSPVNKDLNDNPVDLNVEPE